MKWLIYRNHLSSSISLTTFPGLAQAQAISKSWPQSHSCAQTGTCKHKQLKQLKKGGDKKKVREAAEEVNLP